MNIKKQFEQYVLTTKERIKISSKDIIKGDIFLALKGKKFHGNKFLKSSIDKGAKYCLTDNKEYKHHNNIIYVENLFKYLIKLAIRKRNIYKGKVIGITGSAGKTTLKETLVYFLKKENLVSYSKKSYNNELGVLVSILNLNLKSNYSVFEIGTNNFGEIKNLTKIVKPSEIFITNIQSTHLENFKSKDNIANEKSDIFLSKYNNKRSKLYINITNKAENIIINKALNEKKLKIININKSSNKYYIKEIVTSNKTNKVTFFINKKIIEIEIKTLIMFRIINLLFCYAFFSENFLNLNNISKFHKYLRPVQGRGLSHKIQLNKKKFTVIDDSYNANPDTMDQSIKNFYELKKNNAKKILIIGNMNELGNNSDIMHINLLKNVDKLSFKYILLSGELLRRSINKLHNPTNNFIYFKNSDEIMKFIKKEIHNNDIILIKCSNSTEINKFAKKLIKKGN